MENKMEVVLRKPKNGNKILWFKAEYESGTEHLADWKEDTRDEMQAINIYRNFSIFLSWITLTEKKATIQTIWKKWEGRMKWK